jgi:hypothetical protein
MVIVTKVEDLHQVILLSVCLIDAPFSTARLSWPFDNRAQNF